MTAQPEISVHERTARFLNPISRRRREIVTPEGVVLRVDLAEFGERAAAFMLDFVFCTVSATLLEILAYVTLGNDADDHAVLLSLALLIGFIIRNLYFIHFELIWQGVTPGKRIVGLRVIDRQGGALLPSAVIARNLTRELEIFMPLGAAFLIGNTGPGLWERLMLCTWLLLIGLLPFFNRDRMRGGDFIAGTLVISQPKRRLLKDLVVETADHEFTREQLNAYGAFELQILEELLRRPESPETARLRRDVCEKICAKIGWPHRVTWADTVDFLNRFYAAQRAYLEREQLYGRARDDKNSPPRKGA